MLFNEVTSEDERIMMTTLHQFIRDECEFAYSTPVPVSYRWQFTAITRLIKVAVT